MLSIIIVQLRQLGKNKLKFIVLALLALIPLFAVANFEDGYYTERAELSACQFIIENIQNYFYLTYMFIGIAVGDICAGDFNDKTFYTELLSGRTRFQSYFGRAVPALIVSLIGTAIIVGAPVAASAAAYGWGTLFTPAEFLQRMLLELLPLTRIICLYIGLSFVIRNYYVITVLGLGGFMAAEITGGFFIEAPPAVLGSLSVDRLCRFDMWATYGIKDDIHYVVDTVIPGGELKAIAAASLIAAAAYLVLGYSFFHRDDLN